MKTDETVEIKVALLMQILHILSYSDGYLSGIDKADVYISDQVNSLVCDILSLFEKGEKT